MNEAVLAVVAMVLLLGVVAFGVGHKGWSWGTVIAGVLVILTAPGYLYLALRVVERERVWREKIVKLQNSIVQVRDAMVADQTGPKKGILKLDGKEQSIVSLGLQQARWQRAVQRVNTWRNRHWDNATFGPPRNDKAGTLTLPFPNDAADTSPINEGAELAVFDNTAVENGGRFLGIFQVTDIQTDAEKKSHTLTVRSATQPDNIDEKLWSKNYDTVSIYEDLPVDRWLAFYATTQSADETTDTLLIPEPQKNQGSADEMLKSLETQLESFHKHEEVVEESAWKQLAEEKDKRLIPLGEYWASVVPPGLETRSRTCAGCSPVCSRSAAVPASVSMARDNASGAGKPACTPPSTRASTTMARKPGPDPDKPVTPFISDSFVSCTCPTALSKVLTRNASLDEICWVRQTTETPRPTRLGVLGITRTIF